jgi:hypothetical protein
MLKVCFALNPKLAALQIDIGPQRRREPKQERSFVQR